MLDTWGLLRAQICSTPVGYHAGLVRLSLMSCSQWSQTFCFSLLQVHVCLDFHTKLIAGASATVLAKIRHALYHIVLQLGPAGKQHSLSAATVFDGSHWQQPHQAGSICELKTGAAMITIMKVHQID